MPQIRANNVELFFEEKGSGPEVMLFSHGYLMDHTMYDHQVAAFKDEFRCIAYDQRGHGRSEPITSSYDMDAIVNDAISLIEALEHCAGAFCGHVDGWFCRTAPCFAPSGSAQIAGAHRHLVRPGREKQVVAVQPAAQNGEPGWLAASYWPGDADFVL